MRENSGPGGRGAGGPGAGGRGAGVGGPGGGGGIFNVQLVPLGFVPGSALGPDTSNSSNGYASFSLVY